MNAMGPISQVDLLPALFEGSGAPANLLLGIPLKCGEASNRCVELAWPWPKVGEVWLDASEPALGPEQGIKEVVSGSCSQLLSLP